MKRITLLLAITSLLFACTQPQQQLRKNISEKEKALFADSSMIPDKKKTAELVKLYIEYADKFQDDTSTADYLFKAGDLSNSMHQPVQAIELFGRVQRYHAYRKVPAALFLQGFIAETELHDLNQAKAYYESFLQKYPQHELADDVKMSIKNLGKTPEELIREFEAAQVQDTLANK